MADRPGPDRSHADGDGTPEPPGSPDGGLLPLYHERPREFYLLWAVALLTYGIGDTITTTVAVFRVPMLVESNPVVSTLLDYGGLSGLLLAKLLVFLVMLGISVRGTRQDDRFTYYWPPVATALLGVVLTGWNLWLLGTGG